MDKLSSKITALLGLEPRYMEEVLKFLSSIETSSTPLIGVQLVDESPLLLAQLAFTDRKVLSVRSSTTAAEHSRISILASPVPTIVSQKFPKELLAEFPEAVFILDEANREAHEQIKRNFPNCQVLPVNFARISDTPASRVTKCPISNTTDLATKIKISSDDPFWPERIDAAKESLLSLDNPKSSIYLTALENIEFVTPSLSGFELKPQWHFHYMVGRTEKSLALSFIPNLTVEKDVSFINDWVDTSTYRPVKPSKPHKTLGVVFSDRSDPSLLSAVSTSSERPDLTLLSVKQNDFFQEGHSDIYRSLREDFLSHLDFFLPLGDKVLMAPLCLRALSCGVTLILNESDLESFLLQKPDGLALLFSSPKGLAELLAAIAEGKCPSSSLAPRIYAGKFSAWSGLDGFLSLLSLVTDRLSD